MSNWSDITENFTELMEEHLPFSGSTHNTFTLSENVVELSMLPSSIHNGKYSLQVISINPPENYTNSVLDHIYDVRLQIAFELNQNDRLTTFNRAMEDVEAIISKRLTPYTWQDLTDSIINILFIGASPRGFKQGGSTDVYTTVDLDFRCICRKVL